MSLVESYRSMARIRAFEEKCLELSAAGIIKGSIHVCEGQEAIPVGAARALRPDDWVVATYRGHGWAIVKGAPIVGVLAEICHKEGGLNGGRAGSALLSSPEHHFLGENSIVGAGVPIGAGSAVASTRRADGGVTVVSVGDGALSQGALHEGLVFAAAESLPLVVICENNGWSEMTPTSQMIRGSLVDRVSGYGIRALTVDGGDPETVERAVEDALATARAGAGPIFLDCQTVRLRGHYNRDIEHYRSADDKETARAGDPLVRLAARLRDEGVADALLEQIHAEVNEEVRYAAELVADMPDADPSRSSGHAFNHRSTPTPIEVEAAAPTELTFQMALNRALDIELSARPELLVYGEDVGNAGGIFGVTRRLQKKHGRDSVFDTPIAESAILGSAVGAAMRGMRPVVEIMWADFLLVALDQLVNQAANAHYVTRGDLSVPLVVRTQQGATPGSCAQHSQSLEALLAHVPGLKVCLPATPQDAYTMLRAAIADDDPCIVIEARSLYQVKGEVDIAANPALGRGAVLRRQGRDALIVTWGTMVAPALQAADQLSEAGIEVSVLDLRWLRPLDEEALHSAVRAAGGRVVVAHEANLTGGFGAEIVARVQAEHFASLAAPVERVAAPDIRVPAAPSLQKAVLPGVRQLVETCRGLLSPDITGARSARGAGEAVVR
ncbi:alpha-ketoacid dehydrogenase subunit alpha/beta [Prauserella endophytica]|uniref:dihydrolipoyllysine-residue succinyltransferase n=1 Tax=Prauserella endophytica TaxID=1592324 RepID=A0ABY2S713_9PSEU|nr:alpha-ketoacid dehydrogenase subunit alpha/beta [Prauserella endophytica]TKG71698.1 transketolase [Prauserella endophytica]